MLRRTEVDPELQTRGVVGSRRRATGRQILSSNERAQFTAEALTSGLTEHGVRISMDLKGRWLDNVLSERRWRSLKDEHVYL
jgi:transposase InsO family protein